MPRKARIVAAGVPHHVVARGNNRQDVFLEPRDRNVYLKILHKHASRRGLRLWGFCLMTNHVHLITLPEKDRSLASALGCAHSEYSRYINTSYDRSGHLWQARYFSCPLDRLHALRALAYVECNPVRAQMVDQPWSYRWSSASAHCGGGDALIELSDIEWRREYSPSRWRSVLASGVSQEAFAERLRDATRLGFAMGEPPFLESLGQQLKRDVQHRPVGRPRKTTVAAA